MTEKVEYKGFFGRLKEMSPESTLMGASSGTLVGFIILGPGGIIPGFLLGGLTGLALEWNHPTRRKVS